MAKDPTKLNFKGKKIHFVGIGGIGMSALARYYLTSDSQISGSDKENSGLINNLINEGIDQIWTPHNKTNIERTNPDFIIYSTAIAQDNEELLWAKENEKIILHRSDLLEITTNQKKLIAISGTHGKTTTSAMISELLIKNNFNPSVLLGGILISNNNNVIVGNGDYFVTEADESDKSFLKGNPYIGIITNIEKDHLENYPGGFEEIKQSFLEFANKSISNNGLIICSQDPIAKEVISKNFLQENPKIISYSTNSNSGQNTICGNYNKRLNFWEVYYKKEFLFSLKLKVPGEHNILNALAATAVGCLLEIKPELIKESLENYEGVKRRFQFLQYSQELTIIDDYAHHPTEIAATIKAAQELNPQRLVIVIQPHQAKRLQDLWNEFKEVISQQEDYIFITDTYIARGNPIEGISSKALVDQINKPKIKYLPGNINEIADFLKKFTKYGDTVLIMGAGNITNAGYKLLNSPQTLVPKTGNN